MKNIHIAIGSTMSRPGNVAENLMEITAFAQQAGAAGADILLTPELSACGYGPYPAVLATAETAGSGPVYDGLAQAAQSTNVVVCAGFVEAAAGKRHLSHYVIYPDGKFLVQRKHCVTLMERPLDPSVPLTGHPEGAADPADPGQPTEIHFNYFDVKGVRCGVAICMDGGIDNLHANFARAGVKLVLAPAGAGGRREDRVTTKDLYTEAGRRKYLEWLERVFFPGTRVTDCIQHRQAMATVNQCGYDGGHQYHLGHGMIINPMGEVVGFFHGLPNLDRQRPMFAHAVVDVDDCLQSGGAGP
jgi:predicted amidohydrolase